MSLKTYRRKRHFGKTPEPAGREAVTRGFAFSVQRHHASHLHYDLRLELDGVLKSWAVPKGPALDPAQRRLAVEVEDHPVEYGTFEGTIPKGEYGGGTVVLWDRGKWTPLDDPREGLRKGHLRFSLDGHKLHGLWDLILMRGRESPGGKRNWLLVKARDKHARPLDRYDVTQARPESVAGVAARRARKVWRSSRTPAKASRRAGRRPSARRRGPSLDPGALTGAVKAPMPERVEPELATLADAPPAGDEWVYEIKFDGYRILAYLQDGKVRLRTRNGNDWTERLPSIATDLSDLAIHDGILDGEVVVLTPHGISSFQALQNALSESGRGQLVYYAFDLLHLDGYDVRGAPLLERKALLARVLRDAPPSVRLTEHVEGGGPAFFARACELGLEGAVAKRKDAPYVGARTRQWLKLKCLTHGLFAVVGYTEPAGSRSAFGALVLGLEDRGELRYAGRVGTGFTEKTLQTILSKLRPMERPTPPLSNPPKGAAARGVRWVEPRLAADVAFGDWTDAGILRHPRFLGLRDDKPAETGTSAGIRLSHPEKVLYPEAGITKLELARYYETVAESALPHLARRPLSLVRCPAGRAGHCFYQKHLSKDHPESLHGVEITEGGATRTYTYIDDLAGLVSLVQLGALEIHPWGSRVETLETPDVLTFDLDPAPDVGWPRLLAAALETRARLKALGLRSFVKSTGGKGLHVVAPLLPRAGWASVKAFSKTLVELMVREAPTLYTSKMTKSLRPGRIYLDYLRNGRGSTAVGAYSTRARENAPVAAPLAWDELSAKHRPALVTVRTMSARLAALKADPWKGFFETRQSLGALSAPKPNEV
jgi:bifunctional non-homologous end joining protein LigD